MNTQTGYKGSSPISLTLPGLKAGVATDFHTISSAQDENQNFINKYTKAGKIIHVLKYGVKTEGDPKKKYLTPRNALGLITSELSSPIEDALNSLNLPASLIVLPIPSYFDSHWEKERKYQYKIADVVAELLEVNRYENLKKVVPTRAKTMAENAAFSHGDFLLSPQISYPNTNVLLVDDIFGNGTSASACIDLLKADPNVNDIYLLTVTKIRTTGLKGS